MANESAPTPQPAPESQPGPADSPARVIQVRHDLRGPLGHIMGFAELLLEAARKKNQAPAIEDLAVLCRASEAMIPRVNLCLDPHNVASGVSDLTGLLQEIQRFCAAVQSATGRLGPLLHTWADPAVLADLDRITDSARRMQTVALAHLPDLVSPRRSPSHQPGAGRVATDFSMEVLAGIEWSVLGYFLPRFVIECLKQRQDATPEAFLEVTLLAAGLVDFEPSADAASGQEQFRDLQKVFAAFDQLCETREVEKIKVCRARYLAGAGFPFTRPDHAAAAAELALAMQEKAAQFQTGPGVSIRLRIALATGPVVAGLIGSRRVEFDLWGPTVEMVWSLFAQAPPGEILVSPSTQARLPKDYQLDSTGLRPGPGGGNSGVCRLLGPGTNRLASS